MRTSIKIVITSDYEILIDNFVSGLKANGDHGELRREIGVDFFKKEMTIEGKDYLFQIWEMGTKEEQSALYLGTHAGIVIFDKNKKESFKSVHKLVKHIWNNNGRGIIPIVIIGLENEEEATDAVNDEAIINYCEELSKKTMDYGFEVKYLTFGKKDEIDAELCLQSLSTSYRSYFDPPLIKKVLIKTLIVSDYEYLIDEFSSRLDGVHRETRFRNRLGFDFFIKEMKIQEKYIKFQLWEMKPEDSEKDLPIHYLGSTAGIIIFDKSKKETFVNIQKLISKIWNKNGKGIIPIIIIGFTNEEEANNAVSDDLANAYCEELFTQTKEYGFEVNYFTFNLKGEKRTDLCLQSLGTSLISYFKVMRGKNSTLPENDI